MSVLAFILVFRGMGSILPEADDVLLQFVYGTVRFMLSIIAFGLASFGLVQAKIAPKEMVIKLGLILWWIFFSSLWSKGSAFIGIDWLVSHQ